ncbi:MAG: hypothetical protein JSV91_06010 [Phycisphaerales bacterium]|nr:MAG: hypothetical protein JSV91_06010 [Phycisphaerales bacterium]
MAITRFVLRWGLISGLALGGATLLIGPERVAAGLAHVRSHAQSVVDQCTDDPAALRRQLASLAEQYPDRIAEVRGEIAEVDHQLGQFQHDVEIATRVVALTTDDLNQLKTLVTRAQAQSNGGVRAVAIRWEGFVYDVEECYTEARRINHVRQTYRDRLGHNEQQIKFLTEQKVRLAEILETLESEYDTYQAQLWQLDREIDAIQRNEKLIELTEQQQATLDSYSRYEKVGSLKQLEAKLAELRTIQEAQLQALAKRGMQTDYFDKAVQSMESPGFEDDPFAEILDVIETEDVEEVEVIDGTSNSVAWLD